MLSNSPLTADTDLEQQVEQQIQRRTFGRVSQVRVENHDTHVVVRGSAASYYAVQLVVVAVREVLPEMPVVLDVQVGPNKPRRLAY